MKNVPLPSRERARQRGMCSSTSRRIQSTADASARDGTDEVPLEAVPLSPARHGDRASARETDHSVRCLLPTRGEGASFQQPSAIQRLHGCSTICSMIAVDWGTSSFRAYRLERGRRCGRAAQRTAGDHAGRGRSLRRGAGSSGRRLAVGGRGAGGDERHDRQPPGLGGGALRELPGWCGARSPPGCAKCAGASGAPGLRPGCRAATRPACPMSCAGRKRRSSVCSTSCRRAPGSACPARTANGSKCATAWWCASPPT